MLVKFHQIEIAFTRMPIKLYFLDDSINDNLESGEILHLIKILPAI